MSRSWLALPLIALAACGEGNTPLLTSESGGDAAVPFAAVVAPTVYSGNQRCTDLGYDFGFKVDQSGTNVNGTWTVPGLGSVTITGDGTTWSWTSTFGVDAALAKGGNIGGNIYRYSPESYGDNGLTQPINPSGAPAAISHVEFCFDLELRVSKTAATTYTRTWTWAIDKSGSTGSLLLQNGQTAPAVNYAVDATSTSVDSDWAANGTITIYNPAPFATNVTSVTDLMTGDIAGSVDCGTLPASIAAGGTMTCTWSSPLPDASPRLNTATATADGTTGSFGSAPAGTALWGSGAVGSGSGNADVVFGAPTTLTDESATVSDTRQGTLGTVTGSGHWTYSIVFGPYATCGERDEGNTASFTTNDNGATGSDSWNVHVSVTGCDNGGGGPPPGYGCTLTQGYWKTHSAVGPAPYDNGWLAIGALQQNTPFYTSGKTWLGVFQTPPQGNQYYVLAHQFMAARLNVLNGASTTAAVDAALAQAAAIFSATSGVKLSNANKALAITLAATLDQYNNGLIGPGHCSE